MTDKEKIEQINNFLDCIAKYKSNSVEYIMELHILNTNICELTNTYKKFQKNIYDTKYYFKNVPSPYINKEMYTFLDNNLQLLEIEEKDLLIGVNISQTTNQNIFATFSSWFYKPTEDGIEINKVLPARDALLEQINELFLIHEHNFQFFSSKSNLDIEQSEITLVDIPKFYVIKEEPNSLMTGNIYSFGSFHLFIAFKNITYMLAFSFYD